MEGDDSKGKPRQGNSCPDQHRWCRYDTHTTFLPLNGSISSLFLSSSWSWNLLCRLLVGTILVLLTAVEPLPFFRAH